MSEATLEWWYNPWRERPTTALAATGGVATIAALAVAADLAAIAIAILLLAANSQLGPAFWPLRCRLDQDGVHWGLGVRSRRPWGDFRRARVRDDGLLLSPHARPSRLDSFQALFLPFPAGDRQRLLDGVRSQIAAHGL